MLFEIHVFVYIWKNNFTKLILVQSRDFNIHLNTMLLSAWVCVKCYSFDLLLYWLYTRRYKKVYLFDPTSDQLNLFPTWPISLNPFSWIFILRLLTRFLRFGTTVPRFDSCLLYTSHNKPSNRLHGNQRCGGQFLNQR